MKKIASRNIYLIYSDPRYRVYGAYGPLTMSRNTSSAHDKRVDLIQKAQNVEAAESYVLAPWAPCPHIVPKIPLFLPRGLLLDSTTRLRDPKHIPYSVSLRSKKLELPQLTCSSVQL
ncbi:unnamed protein product [Sphenostylis stenocarpa]|uniref:Uncharacterized protein n=1 Tax=Sphenostylis stenocarpa TaxID=92480 RepID=A0AA86SY98_9FABA|nr:unnamed protein product [Sphenostylis stenocarpa]